MKPASAVVAFREALAELVPDLALSLGAWAERLHALVGPLHAARPEPLGDPDGFDGLSRRGLYERLTPFEWLLADEAPDEFLRRAASGEHAFFRLTHRGPVGSRRCVALAAGGAELLGAPRLLTLAALLALSRRAAEAQADFSWAFWGASGLTFYERLDEGGVRRWLREGRAFVGPSAGEVAAFFEERVRPASPDDAWLLGGARPAGEAKGPAFASLSVEQVHDLEGRRARVRLERPGASPRSLELALPEPPLAARWLRSPFVPAPPPVRKMPAVDAAAPDVPPALSGDGRRLFVRLENGHIATFAVPTSPQDAPPVPVFLRPQRGGRLLAAGSAGKALWGVELAGRTFWLYRFGKRGGVGREHSFLLAEGADEPAHDSFAMAPLILQNGRAFEGPGRTYKPLAFLFLKPRFWVLEAGAHPSTIYEGDAIALGRGSYGEGAVLCRVGEGKELAFSTWVPPARHNQLLTSRLELDAFAGGDEAFFSEWGGAGAVALRVPGGAFRIAYAEAWHKDRFDFTLSSLAIEEPKGARTVGLTHWPSVDDPALVVLGADGRTFSYVGAKGSKDIVEAQGPVKAASFLPSSRKLAYRLESGLLVVRALGEEQDRLRLDSAPGVSS